MKNTIFIRLLNYQNKGEFLTELIANLHAEVSVGNDFYVVAPESFRQVPNTPFCYWVSERIRRLFSELPSFEGEGRTVKQGLATADDFRFVRSWWEVTPEKKLNGMHYPDELARERKESIKIEKRSEEHVSKFQSWCRKMTCEGKRWVPFAKGGEYSPYYADVHLVVNWENDGAEIFNFVDPKTGRTYSRPQNVAYYFRPGLTWSDRTSLFLSVKPWPAGGVFSVKGSAGFFKGESLFNICGFMNTKLFNAFLEMLVNAGTAVSRSYQVGVIGLVPLVHQVETINGVIDELSYNIWLLKERIDSTIDNSHVFVLPKLLVYKGNSLSSCAEMWYKNEMEMEKEITRNQAKIDDIVFKLYEFTEEERVFMNRGYNISEKKCGSERKTQTQILNDLELNSSYKESIVNKYLLVVTNFISWCLGLAFGRFDIRFSLDSSYVPNPPHPFDPLPVCSPGMLVKPSGLPADSGNIVSEEWLHARPDAGSLPPDGSVQNPTIPDKDYPIRISWGGILVDDPGLNGGQLHREDIVRRVREVLELLWADKAQDIEDEACEILSVNELREYFRKPSGFFQDHLRRYSKSRRKAPIYWPLSTRSGGYTIWLYYHRLTDQTLYTVVNKYLEPKINEVQRCINRIEKELMGGSGKSQSNLKDRLSKFREFLVELNEMQDELLRVAELPYRPNLNDGVIINAAPLHNLFRLRSWAKDTAGCWDKLENGDYDWAHLAYTIWPERVKEACKKDRSIAIAHDLEGLYEK